MGALEGKVVIVTGAAQGMGLRHAQRCAEAGAEVVLTDVQADRIAEAAAGIGGAARAVAHDVTDPASWDEVFATAQREFGRLDGLVNNAAILRGTRPIEEEDIAILQQTLQVNVVGTWWGIKKAIAPLRAAGGGSIVNISSLAGLKGLPGYGSYGASKWAVRGLTKVASKELSGQGIRVNSVHPGGVEGTGMHTTPADEEERSRRAAAMPFGRFCTTDDVSSLVLFLLSDASSYITGVEHVIDGGAVV